MKYYIVSVANITEGIPIAIQHRKALYVIGGHWFEMKTVITMN